MAKTREEHTEPIPSPPAPHMGSGGDNYSVTFAGLRPHTVRAASPEEAVEKAKSELGVVSTETAPDVHKVP